MGAIGGAVALSSTEASARWGGRGWGGGHAAFGSVGIGRVGGWGWRGAGGRGAGWGWRGGGGGGARERHASRRDPSAVGLLAVVPASWGRGESLGLLTKPADILAKWRRR